MINDDCNCELDCTVREMRLCRAQTVSPWEVVAPLGRAHWLAGRLAQTVSPWEVVVKRMPKRMCPFGILENGVFLAIPWENLPAIEGASS